MSTATDLIGWPVITWSDPGIYAYGGPSDHPGMNSTAYHLLGGGLPTHYTDPDRVAPAETPIPARDERVRVTKLTHKPAAWTAGPWELTVDGQTFNYYRTKREATADGLRRVAILDWHAAQVDGQAAG